MTAYGFLLGVLVVYGLFSAWLPWIWRLFVPIVVAVIILLWVRWDVRKGFKGDPEAREEYERDVAKWQSENPDKSLDDPY